MGVNHWGLLTVMLLPTRINYKDYLLGLPTIVSCYVAIMGINKGSLLGILNSLPLWQTSIIPWKLKEKIPAHMIIPWKLKKEDTGTYDNTTEASDNTTTKRIAAVCFLPLFPTNHKWIVEKKG